MIMNPNILNKNPLMFFDRAVNAQRSQLLTVMADAVSECRTAADQAAELNETGQMGLLRLAEVWSTNDSLDDYDYGEEDSEEWETEDEESDEPDADGGSTEEDDEDSVK